MIPDIAEFDQQDPSCLRAELAKLRALLAAAGDSQPALSRSLIDSIRGCAAEFDKQQARRHLYIHRDALTRIGHAIVEICAEEIRGLPGWEDVLDRIGNRIAGVGTTNTKREIEDLTGRPR
jgi:hypothetical protein